MSTLYFVVPEPSLTAPIVSELRSNGLSMDEIRLVADEGTDLGDLPHSDFGGATFGAWLSHLVGFDYSGRQVKKFEAAINAGEVLIIVRCPDERSGEVKKLVTDRHPQAFFGGEDDMVPPAV